ncbi:MAG: non-homologous end-joining DNA ligase, partial [Luteimonas sp.]
DIGDQTTPAQRISSPGKVLYPDSGITKQQVADYYRAIAPLLLPELARRPLSLLRCPDGLEGQCFFQKHHADTLGAHVHAVSIREKDGGSDDYLYVDDVEGVLDLVQMNALELHPWGARIDDVEHPDRLVFDLDPGEGVDWKAIVAAAREVRAKLDEIGLESFVRLSGGKGLHVVLPIKPGPSWTQAKSFCEAFADAMSTQAPQRYVATATKARRKGVIFIDWLRNGRGATSVASWSLRARKEAGVAMPLAWSELGRTKSGANYTLERALRRAASLRKDPWEGWAQATKQKLVELG